MPHVSRRGEIRLVRRHLPWRRLLLLVPLVALHWDAAASEFLTTPAVSWTYDLPSLVGTSQAGGANAQQQRQQQPQRRRLQQQQQQDSSQGDRVGHGNAVTLSSDGSQLYITESDGALHIVSTAASGSAGRTSLTYRPGDETTGETNSSSTTTSTLITTCSGGVAVYDDALVVYAVTDRPSGDSSSNAAGDDAAASSNEVASSRILAVDRGMGVLAWTVKLGGTVVGTPWISGRHLYVVRNTATNGYVTVLELDPDGSAGAQVAATVPDPASTGGGGGSTSLGWLGPLTGRTVTMNGVERDVVVMALATNPSGNGDATTSGGGGGPNNQGSSNSNSQGGLYALVPSASFDDLQGRTADAYAMRIVSSYPALTDLRPAFDGTSIYLAHQDRMSGWEGSDQDLSGVWDGTNQDRVPSWETRRSDNTVYPCSPVLSPDSTLLLVSTPAPGLSCRNIAASTNVWSDNTNDVNVAEPVVATIPGASESVVYSVQQDLGAVRQYSLSDGTMKWEVDCVTVTGENSCGLSVKAEFSVSSNGNMLYYAFSNGTVVGLSVGDFPTDPPVVSPTSSPSQETGVSTSRGPTLSPALRGSNTTNNNGNSQAESESAQSKSSPFTLPVILGAAASGLVILIALVGFFMYCRKQNRVDKSGQEQTANEVEAVRKWNEDKDAYNRACKQQEEETLQEISAASSPTEQETSKSPSSTAQTPKLSPGTRRRGSSVSRQKAAPIPLDSITEAADCDDGSEAGVEVSIADESEKQKVMSYDDSHKVEVTQPRLDVAAAAAPLLDPQGVIDLDDDPTPRREDMTAIVRNLSSSFSEVADPPPPSPLSEAAASGRARIISKPDPESTGLGSSSDSKKSAHIELIQAVRESRQTKNTDASVFSATTTTTDGEHVIYGTEDDIVRSSTKADDSSDYRGRPTSPDFSDVWSADGSLYLDEESRATLDRSAVAPAPSVEPEDEPGQISKGSRPKSPDPPPLSQRQPNPESNLQKVSHRHTMAEGTPSIARRPSPNRESASAMQAGHAYNGSSSSTNRIGPISSHSSSTPPRPPAQPRISPQVRGGSARPRAGLFTRRENPLVSSNGSSSDSGSEAVPEGYLPEREARATYTPMTMNHKVVPDPVLSSTSPRSAASSKASHKTDRVSNKALNSSQYNGSEEQSAHSSSAPSPPNDAPSRRLKKSSSGTRQKTVEGGKRSAQSSKQETSKAKTGASSAWDSFLSELAKVEDTFFNPKLGASNATQGKGGKRRRPPPHSRRSESADDVSDSDSDSSFSAGLNPVV